MPLYVVFSEYQVSREEAQKVFPEHFAYLDRLQAQKKVFAAGPFTDRRGAMIIFSATSMKEAEELACNDPIHREAVRKFHIREWKPVRLLNWGLGEEKLSS